MITVKVIFKSYLKMITGISEFEQILDDGSSIYDLAINLGERFGSEVKDYIFDPNTGMPNVLFTCNKKMCIKEFILQSGDVVSIYPALAGG